MWTDTKNINFSLFYKCEPVFFLCDHSFQCQHMVVKNSVNKHSCCFWFGFVKRLHTQL